MKKILSLICSLLVFSSCSKVTQVKTPALTPEIHTRSHSQTFLTFPEWFLVFSPEEFASQMKEKEAHHFPYFRHLSQFWGSYLSIINRTKQDEKINFEYHVMIMVIGLSTSVEYFLKVFTK